MKNRKNSFMVNVMIILFSQVAVKVLGLVYRMVITNISGFGDQGTDTIMQVFRYILYFWQYHLWGYQTPYQK